MKTIEELEKEIECLKKDNGLDKKYIEILEKRLKLKTDKYNNLKDRYKMLYEFASKVCEVSENQAQQINDLSKVNKELVDVNEQLAKKLNDKIFLIL